MSRRRTRSEADSCGALLFELPDELEHKEESSLLNSDGTAASLKREKELGVYLELRRERGGNDIRVGELRDAFVKWLRPRSVVLHDEPSSTELRGLGGRTVSDLPPAAVNYTMTDGSKKLFVDAVNESIRSSDWHELWVLLGQAEAWTARMHNPSAERPWWMLCHDSVTDWPSELVDIAALEDEGGAGNPLDPEVQPSAKQQRVGVKVKEEAAASTSTAVTKHPLDDVDWKAVSDGKQDEDLSPQLPTGHDAIVTCMFRWADANFMHKAHAARAPSWKLQARGRSTTDRTCNRPTQRAPAKRTFGLALRQASASSTAPATSRDSSETRTRMSTSLLMPLDTRC